MLQSQACCHAFASSVAFHSQQGEQSSVMIPKALYRTGESRGRRKNHEVHQLEVVPYQGHAQVQAKRLTRALLQQIHEQKL
jgi:hypothetical protein